MTRQTGFDPSFLLLSCVGMPERLTIVGVPVDPLTFKEAAERARSFLKDGRQHLIVTPNPEMAVLADRDPSFRRLLESADLAICDGYGLYLAGLSIPEVITGTDFALALSQIAEQENCSVYLLGGNDGIPELAADHLKGLYPNLKVAGAEWGGRIRFIAGGWEEDPALIERIASTKPDLLFVALGHGKQERWIRDHLAKLPSVKIAIGIGGAFDYYAGNVPRAPKFLRKAGLEWMWRLVVQPWRASRVIDATFKFAWLALKKREKKG